VEQVRQSKQTGEIYFSKLGGRFSYFSIFSMKIIQKFNTSQDIFGGEEERGRKNLGRKHPVQLKSLLRGLE